jgi:transposase-like protein
VRVADQLGVHRGALRAWVRQAEVDSGKRPGTSTSDAQRIAELERDESTALFEARRCLSCGNCFECDNCSSLCPYNAITKNPKMSSRSTRPPPGPRCTAQGRWSSG